MSEPLIRAIMPTCNRDVMAYRTARCFNAQTYPDAYMVVLNSGTSWLELPNHRNVQLWFPDFKKFSIGVLRNWCIQEPAYKKERPDYIAHFDDDDICAPARLEKQLEHIRQTGKEVTGFYNMPMYDAKNDKVWIYANPRTNYSLGNCLFYKRSAWERERFPDKTPEDNIWRKNIGGENIESRSVFEPDGSPLMIQVVHGANASASIIRSSVYYQSATFDQENKVRALLEQSR